MGQEGVFDSHIIVSGSAGSSAAFDEWRSKAKQDLLFSINDYVHDSKCFLLSCRGGGNRESTYEEYRTFDMPHMRDHTATIPHRVINI